MTMINPLEKETGYRVDGFGGRMSTAEGYAFEARWCLQRANRADNKYEVWQWQMMAFHWYELAAMARRNGR